MHRVYRQERARAKSRHDDPRVSIVQLGNHERFRLLKIGDSSYYVPQFVKNEDLAPIYNEVFCDTHPHFYEHGECKVRPNDVVIDAGASEGFFTRFALSRGARVIAVEPSLIWVDALHQTFEREIADGRVVVKRVCLGDRIGEASLSISQDIGWVNGSKGGVWETVPLTTIDALLTSVPWEGCHFIKMDIEGAERTAVAGASDTLRRCRPSLSIAVYHHPTGYLDIRQDLRRQRLDYHVTAKGLQPRRAFQVPVLLHAWCDSALSRQAQQ